MTEQYAIECRQITKAFGSVVANDKIDLTVRYGEIMALLGENGSGKTTLMNMLSGIYHPDAGSILVGGKEVSINSPVDSRNLGIGMIHQHFKLVDVFSAMDNIVLGTKGKRLGRKALREKIEALGQSFGLEIEPEKKVYDMSVSEKQTVEIIKVLYRGADILILDEPTAVLTPQETDRLFDVMRNMKADGKALVIITHKLHEVMDVSDRVAVLRKGRYIGDVATCDTSPQKLTDMMVGHAVTLNIDRPLVEDRNLRLEVKDLTVLTPDGIKALEKELLAQNAELCGAKVNKGELFTKLFNLSLQGAPDCGGVIPVNYYSGEGVTHFDAGRPMLLRGPESDFSLANLMRANIYSAFATLAIGLDILNEEHVALDTLLGHGGLFKTPGVAQRYLAAAAHTAVTCTETAGEGGPYGMALLAAYRVEHADGETLANYLQNRVFAGAASTTLNPDAADEAGFAAFLKEYKKALCAERTAVETM